MIFLAFSALNARRAAAHSASETVVKTRQFEGGQLEYRVEIENKPGARYDGQAFTRSRNGKTSYVVVLNRAFFAKESKEIFRRLQQGHRPAPPPELFQNALADLDSWAAQSRPRSQPEGKDFVARLRLVQTYLEDLAWRGAYEACLAKETAAGEAERCFTAAFSASRLATIEEHEVAHLLDLAAGGDPDSAGFARYTELNAFYAELFRGANPLDTLSQALVGGMEELRRGATVDYSLEKIRRVLTFITSSRRFRPLLARASGPRCCLEVLAQLSPEDFVFTGRELGRQNRLL